ncbi:hypothetical protein P171DRAFT_439042 [Karstenula rhodostoma CBS 690.94]|uniref:Uncharacterized protein n=1 Tax=Karstenula rhodostoma CBS 690.94 TaxID=1392251 RepID=A0A9P4UIJ9_9PLEO|nr:hypothetical protein P171DRAFT_439042 [Karstenula rhodostoma CBS 690.94]
MGSIFNTNGVPHLNTPNSCSPIRYQEQVVLPQAAKISSDANNTVEATQEPACTEDYETVHKRILEYDKKLFDYYRESGKRLDKIQEELDELSIYLGLCRESDSDSDSGDKPADTGRLEPLPSSDCTSTELVCLADCYNPPSYKSCQEEDTDRNSDPAAEKPPRTWSGPGPHTTSPLDTFFNHYFLSDRSKRNIWIPSRKKTKNPIILYGATDINAIHTTAKRIKGLHTCSAGAPPNRAVVLGWDRHAVWLRASELAASSYSEDARRYIFDTAQKFAKAMQGQRVGLRLNKAENWTDNASEGVLDQFQGSYLVRWRDVGGGWDVRAVLGLEIGMGPRRDILEATLRFHGAEEKMLLAHKEKTLNAYLDGSLRDKEEDRDDKGEDKGENNSRKGGNNDTEKAGDAQGESVGNDKDEMADSNDAASSGDYKTEPADDEHENPSQHPDLGTMENPIRSTPPFAVSQDSQNPPRGTMGNPHEFVFIAELCYRVVGRSTEGCRGRIHWTADQTFTSFTGDGILPYLSGRVEMEGWEV